MFFYKKRHKKHKNKGGKVYSTSSSLKSKEKKRFGLTQNEMDDLVLNLMVKTKIPVVSIK